MRSTDRGETWEDHRPDAQPDVHSLAWHPRAAGRAYEAGGGGSAFSEDAGETWQRADDGRDRNYTWSVAVDPDDPECWYVSASTGPSPRTAAATRRRASTGGATASRGKRSAAGSPSRCPRCRTHSSPQTDASSPAWPTGSCGRAATAATPGARATLRGDALPAINALAYARDDDPDERLRSVTIGEPQLLAGPVLLAEYDPDWPQLFRHEADRIRGALGPRALQVEHVGSTSVPGLAAKPIIDISLAVADSADEQAYVPALEAAGYFLRIREPDWFEHRAFGREGVRVNLHVFSAGCAEIDRMLRFRDRLRSDDADRALYERTKRELAQRQWKYVQNYADAKSAVVEAILARAGDRAFIESS